MRMEEPGSSRIRNAESQRGPGSPRYRVMVVEPAEDKRRLITFVLEVDGRFQVVEAWAPGRTAALRARAVRPGAIVATSMPTGSGTRWSVQRLRENCPDAVIVVLSQARNLNPVNGSDAQVRGRDADWPHELVETLAGFAGEQDGYMEWPAWERRHRERRRKERRSRSDPAPGAEQRRGQRRQGERRRAA